MVFGTKNMWLPLIVSLISFEVNRCEMNLVILNINGGGASVLETTPSNMEEEEEGGVLETTPKPVEKNYFVYEYTGSSISINKAKEACQSQHAVAVIPESEDEVKNILTLATPYGGNYFIPTELKLVNNQIVYADSTPYNGSVPTALKGDSLKDSYYLKVQGDAYGFVALKGDHMTPAFSVICEDLP